MATMPSMVYKTQQQTKRGCNRKKLRSHDAFHGVQKLATQHQILGRKNAVGFEGEILPDIKYVFQSGAQKRKTSLPQHENKRTQKLDTKQNEIKNEQKTRNKTCGKSNQSGEQKKTDQKPNRTDLDWTKLN